MIKLAKSTLTFKEEDLIDIALQQLALEYKKQDNYELYKEYMEKAIYYNNRPRREIVIMGFKYFADLYYWGNEPYRIITLAKFLDEEYPGSLELLLFFTNYKEKLPQEKQKVQMELIFSGVLKKQYE